MKAETGHGRIVASFGQRGMLDTGTGAARKYLLKGRKLKAVCGDLVRWEAGADADELLVTAIDDRSNILSRPDSSGRPELLAANLTRLFLVLAPAPEPDYFVADRYLCAAELMGAEAVVVWNKSDLAAKPAPPVVEYAALGYPVIPVSCETGTGMNKLAAYLQDGIGMLVGQSGVGKSSIINRLVPEASVATGELSRASLEGRHTTTASYMHHLASGGSLIDSPGVREFAPVIAAVGEVQHGFREFSERLGSCRFSDCLHTREPDCAIKAAVEAGEISGRRYESYKRLCNSVAGLRRN